jgi:putative oxidoreductase
MKIVALIARILLGLIFVVFGANGLHPFLPTPPPPAGLAGQYVVALYQSHYAVVPFLVQLIGGILLLAGWYVPLALAILGPVIVNILCFHVFLLRTGLPTAIVVAILWLILFYYYRRSFAGIFEARPVV